MLSVSEALEIVEKARREGRRVLLEHEAKTLCSLFGIPIAKSVLAKTVEDAVKIAKTIGFPVVLKIVSPDILHKSDVGGVKLNISTEEELIRNFNNILQSVKKKMPKARIEGVLIQEMVPPSVEVIIGAVKDPFFGHAVMFGLGGIFVEILRDVSFRVVPLSEKDAYEMIKEIKAYPILKGYRNMPPRDIKTIVNILLNVSHMLEKITMIRELDLNPIMVYEEGKGAKVVDVKIIVE